MTPIGVVFVSSVRWTARTVEWRRLTSRPWPNVCWTSERLYQCCIAYSDLEARTSLEMVAVVSRRLIEVGCWKSPCPLCWDGERWCVARPAPFSTLPNHSVLYIYIYYTLRTANCEQRASSDMTITAGRSVSQSRVYSQTEQSSQSSVAHSSLVDCRRDQ